MHTDGCASDQANSNASSGKGSRKDPCEEDGDLVNTDASKQRASIAFFLFKASG